MTNSRFLAAMRIGVMGLVMGFMETTTLNAQISISLAPAPVFSALSVGAPTNDAGAFHNSLRLDQDIPPAFSPVDTVRMSRWERIWWGRHGLMRVGFKLDNENPVNDLRQMAKARRKMLSLHQALGLATIASMAVTVTGGYRAAAGKGNGLHNASMPITIGLYSATAALALTSPPKLVPSRSHWDTIRVHRLLAVVHVAGMVLTPMLAPEEGQGSVKWHRAAGVVTFATFTTSMLVVMLFQ